MGLNCPNLSALFSLDFTFFLGGTLPCQSRWGSLIVILQPPQQDWLSLKVILLSQRQGSR